MSKDPFEELFGIGDDSDPEPESQRTSQSEPVQSEPVQSEPETAQFPEPVPARQRLAQEQAERVQTSPLFMNDVPQDPVSQDPTSQLVPPQNRTSGAMTPHPQTAGMAAAGNASASDADTDRAAKAKPWIIVGIITVLALIGSIMFMNFARAGGEADTAATPTPTQSTAPTTPSPTPTATPDAEADAEEEEDEPDADEPPKVDVGTTGPMDVPAWGITAQISGKFGWPQYTITGENLVLQYSPLIESLPDSCAAMRSQWGIQRVNGNQFEVLKPAERCEDAPELYDELWGLTAAMVESITPQ